ncbi:hypothetical protein C4569_00325 [Candidatus Parcubacteria bacterium]|nr:MAG: hypothetical protein C4569_00325 [Candidatus Parcubacteria bacterium]
MKKIVVPVLIILIATIIAISGFALYQKKQQARLNQQINVNVKKDKEIKNGGSINKPQENYLSWQKEKQGEFVKIFSKALGLEFTIKSDYDEIQLEQQPNYFVVARVAVNDNPLHRFHIQIIYEYYNMRDEKGKIIEPESLEKYFQNMYKNGYGLDHTTLSYTEREKNSNGLNLLKVVTSSPRPDGDLKGSHYCIEYKKVVISEDKRPSDYICIYHSKELDEQYQQALATLNITK